MTPNEDFATWVSYSHSSTPFLQTLRGLGLAFERDRIAGVREEPRLREQDFGAPSPSSPLPFSLSSMDSGGLEGAHTHYSYTRLSTLRLVTGGGLGVVQETFKTERKCMWRRQ